MTATVASMGTALHSPYVFSFMRRGKAVGPKLDAVESGEGSVAPAASSPTSVPAPALTSTASAGTGGGTSSHVNPYETSIKVITTVSTVEGFWETYDFLKRPNDLPTTTDYHFFRDGIKPTWEDPNNEKGGKWIVRLPKGLASRYWEEIILALIGGQFSGVPDGEICGAVVSVRYSEDIIGVWNRSAADRDMIDRIRDAIKKVLQLPPHANIEYKPHQTSLQDRSSFRNTQVWKPKSSEARASISGTTQNEPRRSNSWVEREERKTKRDTNRAWR